MWGGVIGVREGGPTGLNYFRTILIATCCVNKIEIKTKIPIIDVFVEIRTGSTLFSAMGLVALLKSPSSASAFRSRMPMP